MEEFVVNYKKYVIEIDEENFDNENEVICYIYKNENDYEMGEYIEQVSLKKENLRTNIEEYIDENY